MQASKKSSAGENSSKRGKTLYRPEQVANKGRKTRVKIDFPASFRRHRMTPAFVKDTSPSAPTFSRSPTATVPIDKTQNSNSSVDTSHVTTRSYTRWDFFRISVLLSSFFSHTHTHFFFFKIGAERLRVSGVDGKAGVILATRKSDARVLFLFIQI